jgi:hypothetical protein
MIHYDITYSIMRQRVAALQAQAAADHLASNASKTACAANALQSDEQAAAHRDPDVPRTRGRWLRRPGRLLAGDDGR